MYVAAAFVLIILCTKTMGLSTGPPPEACLSMEPTGHILAGFNSSNLGFSIKTPSYTVRGGDVVNVTVSGSEYIRGIFIQVRDESGTNIVGSFDAPNTVGFQLLECLGVPGGAFAHSNKYKKGKSVSAFWRAPASCAGQHTIRVTVVKDFKSFQTGLTRQISCSLTTVEDTETTPTVQSQSHGEESTVSQLNAVTSSITTTRSTSASTRLINLASSLTTADMQPSTVASLPPAARTSRFLTMTSGSEILPSEESRMSPAISTEASEDVEPRSSSSVVLSRIASSSKPAEQSDITPVPTRNRCRYSSYTIVPNKYQTSFENRDLNGWRNTEWRQPQYNSHYFPSYLRRRWKRGSTYYTASFFYPPARRPNLSRYYSSTTQGPSFTSPSPSTPVYQNIDNSNNENEREDGNEREVNSYESEGNFYGQSGWKRNQGYTPTSRTGPSSASDGKYYMYLEASYYLPGDYVSLSTARDLRGCFCLHLKYHLNIRNFYGIYPKHELSIRTDYEILKTVSSPSRKWKTLQVQVDTSYFTKIKIIGKRGSGSLGDMAIDDIYIRPGSCATYK